MVNTPELRWQSKRNKSVSVRERMWEKYGGETGGCGSLMLQIPGSLRMVNPHLNWKAEAWESRRAAGRGKCWLNNIGGNSGG